MIDHLVHTDFKPVDKRDHVSSIYGWLSGETEKTPVVFDREKPYGIVNERGFMRSHVNQDAKIEGYVIGTRTVTTETPLEDVFDVIAESRIPYVPVTAEDGKKVKGYITAGDALKEKDIPRDIQVAQVMDEVPILAQSNNVGEAIHWLRDVVTSVLPVKDENGRLLGVVRRRELVPLVTDARPSGRKPASGDIADPKQVLIEGYVEHNYDTVSPDAPLHEVREKLAEFGFLIVQNANDEPVGVLTPEGAVQALTQKR